MSCVNTVSSYDNAVICGLVWTTDFIAYRCKTCGLSSCMSLCADCFLAGDHAGHDFNMFRSHAGGACDCGDEGVMRSEGSADLEYIFILFGILFFNGSS